MKLEKLNRDEALRYLGCRGDVTDDKLTALLNICEKNLLEVADARYTYGVYSIDFEDEGIRIANSDILLTGKDIAGHLAGCDRIVLMAATTGQGVDALLRRLQITDMAAAVVTDSLGSVAIEQVCDKAEAEILKEFSAANHTWRYSPGYGDLPLELQRPLISLLQAPKKIGLTVNQGNMMTPTKSVTAIIGLSENEVAPKKRGCATCKLRDKCNFRKTGGHCGN